MALVFTTHHPHLTQILKLTIMTDINLPREEELDFYYLYLKKFIVDYRYPGVTDAMIRERAATAYEAYEVARLNGAPIDEAHETSINVLMEGYRHSDYEMVMKVLETEFTDDIPVELHPFVAEHLLAIGMLDNTFEGYDMQSEDFESSGRMNQLHCELTGLISLFLRSHGL